MTSIVAYDELHPTKAIVDVAEMVMGDAGIILITIAGFLAMISTINMCIVAASRISFAMGRDRNLPFILSMVHPTFKTPHISVLLIGVVVIAGAIIADIEKLAKAANIMVLFAFMLVDFAVICNRNAWCRFLLNLNSAVWSKRFDYRGPRPERRCRMVYLQHH